MTLMTLMTLMPLMPLCPLCPMPLFLLSPYAPFSLIPYAPFPLIPLCPFFSYPPMPLFPSCPLCNPFKVCTRCTIPSSLLTWLQLQLHQSFFATNYRRSFGFSFSLVVSNGTVAHKFLHPPILTLSRRKTTTKKSHNHDNPKKTSHFRYVMLDALRSTVLTWLDQ
jgi:hypothetical protein